MHLLTANTGSDQSTLDDGMSANEDEKEDKSEVSDPAHPLKMNDDPDADDRVHGADQIVPCSAGDYAGGTGEDERGEPEAESNPQQRNG